MASLFGYEAENFNIEMKVFLLIGLLWCDLY